MAKAELKSTGKTTTAVCETCGTLDTRPDGRGTGGTARRHSAEHGHKVNVIRLKTAVYEPVVAPAPSP